MPHLYQPNGALFFIYPINDPIIANSQAKKAAEFALEHLAFIRIVCKFARFV